ncbi:helix-turn-helix domain-containing protein [Salipaludibacillus sp. LMS25]|jgi:DNA-binding XRE family transcriptional regulator|nr:helix-turn-helix domain-containing protein [Salipaludibacillus sp. LMS25]
MTQAQYAKHIGVSEGFVSKIISGDKKLSLLKAKITANLFNCCIDDLYSWEEIDTKGKR